MSTHPDPTTARETLTGHRHYKYRGCAPHWDETLRGRALGDETLTLDAWSASTEDGGEPQKTRLAREQAAKTVCAPCPVLTQCRAYATSYTVDPTTGAARLAEPDGIWGGMLALERHRRLIAQRTAAGQPTDRHLAEARTPQKQAVLAALARETDEELVAYRAGMDVRTANWHRSALCSLLGLNKETATRQQLLDTAAAHGLLPKRCRIVPDGPWPIAAAPTTDGARQRRIAAGMPQQLALDLWDGQPAPRTPKRQPGTDPDPGLGPARAVPGRPRLRLITRTAEQLRFPTADRARLEAAA